jgi:CheY-like chemotaxis protein
MHAAPPADNPASSPRQPAVLFVESDVMLRQTAAHSLREAGFEVVEAATAREALEVVQSSKQIDVLLTELQNTGGLDGAVLTAQARAVRPDIKIVVASGQAPDWPFRRTLDAFIGKPYDNLRMANRIRALLTGEDE